ncbi:hypothetical protein D9613_008645 [Agrocybe pediades]|uniref:Glycosyltransferase family 18 catalytic domain-containing protein n=1 Tax=Agrocybe pediades TaxID=84607 RepID=A0A8H4QSB0_9AGAR|nr:hypothetical protein D9613_008645 [Agrocybe pediades]
MSKRGSSHRKILLYISLSLTLIFLLSGLFHYSTGRPIPALSKAINHISSWNASRPGGYTPEPLHLAQYFPPPSEDRKDYHEWNAQTLRELHSCMAIQNCGPNQRKIALLAAHWFEEAVVRGWRGGEGVWAVSVYKGLRSLGYTTLFANSFKEALEQYRMFPDLVKVVIRNKAGECHADSTCVKGATNPTGIPAWKIFDFEFFASHGGHFHASLLKGKWILSANPDPHFTEETSPIQYIGYSIEEECRKVPTIRLAQRADQVWMLMKQLTYVYNEQFAWNRSYFALASKELGMNFVGGWQIDQHYGGWDPDVKGIMVDFEDREHGVINLGRLGPAEFTKQVGMSKVMIGVGSPWWSPSPYNALCQGVPFVNPILRWNHDKPWDKSSWYTQHPSLNNLEPPFVYNVHARDYEGFIKAIRTASTTEIPSFIPSHMQIPAIEKRLQKLMETDWKVEAALLLQSRLQDIEDGKEAYIFEL